MAVLVGIEAEFFHQARQIGAQGLGSAADPGDNYGFHAHALLALVIGDASATPRSFASVASRTGYGVCAST